MSGEIRVLLPAELAHLANDVLQAGCIPVIDATTGDVPDVPERAWVRTRPAMSQRRARRAARRIRAGLMTHEHAQINTSVV